MRTILNLLDTDLDSIPLEEVGYETAPLHLRCCDVLICDIEQIDYAGVLVSPKSTFFIIALDNPKQDYPLIPNTFKAWIDKKKLSDLPDLLRAYNSQIEEKMEYKKLLSITERFILDNSVHDANLEGIKLNMRESTQEIEKIFEERVEEMRSIHRDTAAAHEKLTVLKEKIVPEEFNELEESWNTTSSILSRTDDVIIAMFEFITILQCEDRITQMIDGISKIMKNDIENALEHGYFLTPDKQTKLKERLIQFYTIQEQRDYAGGIDDALQGQACKPDAIDIEEFTLF